MRKRGANRTESDPYQIEVLPVDVDEQMNDVGESFRFGDEERENVQLLLIDGVLHRLGIDQVSHVDVRLDPRRQNDVLDALQLTLFDGNVEWRFIPAISLGQTAKSLERRVILRSDIPRLRHRP